MKRLLIIAVAGTLLFSACKKSDPPAKTSGGQTTQSLSSQDSSLVGDWALDLQEVYNNGTLVASIPHSDPVNCHLNLKSTFVPGTTTCQKDCIYGLSCTQVNTWWTSSTGLLNVGGNYTIVSLTSTNLVLQTGSISSSGGQANKYYLHK